MINDTHSYEHHPTLIMLNYFVTVHLFANWCCGIITQLFAILSLVIVCSDFQARDFFHAWLAFKSLSGHFRPTQLTRWFPVWKIDFYRWRSWRKKWSCEMKTQLRHYRRFLPKLKCLVLLHFCIVTPDLGCHRSGIIFLWCHLIKIDDWKILYLFYRILLVYFMVKLMK